VTSPETGRPDRSGPEAVVSAAPEPGLKQALPEQSSEDTDVGWGEYPGPADDRLYRDRPPHWDDH